KAVGAGLAWFLLRQHDAVGLLALAGNGHERRAKWLRPAQRSSQLGSLLRSFEGLSAAGGASLEALLTHAARLFHRRSLVLLFSHLLEPVDALERSLRRLRFHGHECVVFQVLDRDEIEFPFSAAAVFEDLETLERRRVDAGRARTRYLER